MTEFIVDGNRLLFAYSPDNGDPNWVRRELDKEGEVWIKRTYTFKSSDIVLMQQEYEDDSEPEGILNFGSDDELIYLHFADIDGDYFKVRRGVLTEHFDIYLHVDVAVKPKFFAADANVSIFGLISSLSRNDFYLGGDAEGAVPLEEFEKLIKFFPTSYERRRYVEARVASVLRNYMDGVKDAEAKFERYLNTKLSKRGTNLTKTFKDAELLKYHTILEKLRAMLKEEAQYNERQWQEEILQIILLLYPKYLFVFKEVPVRATIAGDVRERFLDFLLVDNNGNVDIVEIKRPFEKAIITGEYYRNNYIPLRELSGTVMQIEKYIYYLNRWSEAGEDFLNVKYKDDLPTGFEIKITNPGGIIIMGRENNLSIDQKRDFEVVKRKYKNVIDIITYDNLLERLRFMIEQIKKL
ncbi:DUF4263 domain-containing protein [Niabella sp. W65]|nr:DUF4263 domain-containing protein [Niabella sp. W65]MCH7362721.1 DUF4263 domain-containing protein [Niabella sp. W65]ULT38676.1 DUF4263 domain-containing protein [Niabella sp. I65]